MSTNEIKNQEAVARVNEGAYYPSKQALSALAKQFETPKLKEAIKPGFIARTDGFDVDEIVGMLEAIVEKDPNHSGLLSQALSVSDLSEKLYDRFAANPNSLYNWYPLLVKALAASDTTLKTPHTKTLRLPIELAQFIRIEYNDTSDRDKALFNQFIFDKFGLEDGKTYFIKTGTFSSKFQFANAKCAEPREMGEYFQVINNFAMLVGAGHSVDVVVREYIEDVEHNPTIYNGMPLRTEFRAFIDCDTNDVIGIVPYWHPVVMKRALKNGLADSIQEDYQTYMQHEDKLNREFNEHVGHVRKEIQALLLQLGLTGQYSIDVMKNGDDFYVIDMALMSESALTELL